MRPTRPIRPCRSAAAPAMCWAQAGPRLGACVDAEANGQPNGGATGDDTATARRPSALRQPNDDEDGVRWAGGLVEGVGQQPDHCRAARDLCAQRLDRLQRRRRLERHGRTDREQLQPWPWATTRCLSRRRRLRRRRRRTALPVQHGRRPGTTGEAADGEVEDYTLSIGAGSASNDWGDALDTGPGTGPGNYQTLGERQRCTPCHESPTYTSAPVWTPRRTGNPSRAPLATTLTRRPRFGHVR